MCTSTPPLCGNDANLAFPRSPPANSHQSARPHPDENGAIKMSRGDAYWWIQRGDVDIAHPQTLTHSAIHNTSPGDLWVYFCRGARHIWLREEDSWRRLSADAGTWNGRADRADQVQHPSGSDQWLKFPLEGKPSWLKRASFKGLLKTPR